MSKFDLVFQTPYLNAAGILGFAPDAQTEVAFTGLGAFITNPVSRLPRSPARGTRCLPFTGGFLLHSGNPNLGFDHVVRHYAARWARSPVGVIVHLLAQNNEDLVWMASQLEGREGVIGLEIGLPPNAAPFFAGQIVQALAGELPVILRLPLERAALFVEYLVEQGLEGLPAAISFAPPRGALPRSGALPVSGRLYGPAIFPLALSALQAIRPWGLPVIAAGGVYSLSQAEALLAAGALAVQLDTVLWRSGWIGPPSGK